MNVCFYDSQLGLSYLIKYKSLMSKVDSDKLRQFVLDNYDSKVVPSLFDYIKIDNLSRSFDEAWETNGKLQKAALHIRDWALNLGVEGLTCEMIKDEGYSPLLFTQVKGSLPVTLFFYGHYDKQPPFTGWMEGLGPTQPKIIDNKLYGRGGADDGYSTYSTLLALKGLQDQGIKLPRCVMITQGDEESGSGHMNHYLDVLKERIGEPIAFFCLDSGTLDYDRLWLSTSLRGHMVATLKVTANKHGIHSGTFSGVYPSTFRIARTLVNRLENPLTGQFHPKFKKDITPIRYREAEQLSKYIGDRIITQFPFFEKTKPISSNPLNCILNRSWSPTVTVIGQSGIPPVEGAGNILHPQALIKFSIRLPPNFPIDQAVPLLNQVLLTNVPYNAKAQILNVRAATGWNSTEYEPYFYEAIREASTLFYGNEMMSIGEGGSIPLMGRLQQLWPGRQFLITGVLGPNSNAHGPNEFLHLDYVKKLTCCLGYVVAKCSEHLQSQ